VFCNKVLNALLLDLSKRYHSIDFQIPTVIHTSVTSTNDRADHDLPSVTRSTRKTLTVRNSFLRELSPAIKSLNPDVPILPYSLQNRGSEKKLRRRRTRNKNEHKLNLISLKHQSIGNLDIKILRIGISYRIHTLKSL
jgi:hypothetical protein